MRFNPVCSIHPRLVPFIEYWLEQRLGERDLIVWMEDVSSAEVMLWAHREDGSGVFHRFSRDLATNADDCERLGVEVGQFLDKLVGKDTA